MKKIKIVYGCILLSACISLTSCNEGVVGTSAEQTGQTHVLCSVDPFILSDIIAKSTVNPSNNYAVTWANGDVIGIFPREGYQEPFTIPADQVGNSSATFDGGYWSLKNGLEYNAYYPFDKANFESAESKTTIPVKYTGQTQTGTTCNAGEYDYTYSDWATAANSTVHFSFHHLGAFLVLTLKIPATATYTSLSLNANSTVIPTTGTYDLTAASPAFTLTAKTSSLTMTLNSFSGTAGEDATFYMMLPPCDLSSATLTATLSTGTSTCTYDITSQNIQAAHLYKVTGTPKESSVDGTIDGWVEETHEYVNLGLPSGTLWATTNVGASKPENYGGYFSWGEIEEKNSYLITDYTFYDNEAYTKYNSTDNILILNSTDDVATQKWGSDWSIPTLLQFQELFNSTYTTVTKTTLNNTNVFKITSKTNGNILYIPMAGVKHYNNATVDGAASLAQLWTKNIYEGTVRSDAYGADLRFTGNNNINGVISRYWGLSIRPVRK